ncbi:MAG: hypothetical protein Q4C72_00870 [Eubacteriales bacterium]|nr:hypothetical protein [Eubacteriales bacterium]
MANENGGELPLGLGMALAQHPGAMARFASLSEQEQNAVIAQAHQVQSRGEMRALVDGLSQNSPSA